MDKDLILSEEKGEIVLYQPDDNVRLEVRLQDETVWLTQQQMAEGYPFFSKRSKRLCSFSWRKKKEPKEHPPYQASPIWEDVIDCGQEPPFVKVLV